MGTKTTLTPKLKSNWWIDAVLGFGALLAVLTGLYFLVFPVGGYQGGRNPAYGIVILFERDVWDLLHTWGSVVMILAAMIHIVIHWGWITGTVGRIWEVWMGKRRPFGLRLNYNIILDGAIALSFLICAVSGLYFLFVASSGPEAPVVLIDKTTWDLIHTWSGVLMTFSAVLHFGLHWKWVVNITGKIFGDRSVQEAVTEAGADSVSVH